ncbi:MAG TPA: hypothetical protein VK194_10550, partial [Candidatus Deferrimicrobium sp.]|nr:hypothetical protein [Candidatus Deferrimicrobium sp.]
MREFGTRPRPSPLVVQTAFVVGGFVVAAVVGQANLLVAFVILLATGVVVGTRERPRWETI